MNVFDKMTPNQRLLVAMALSVIFFMVYGTLFPQKPIKNDANKTKKIEKNTKTEQKPATTLKAELKASSDSTILSTIKSKDFVLKLDTLGRIAYKELLDEKFRDSDDLHAQIVPKNGAKPLFIRFLDEKLNEESVKTPYTVDITDANVTDKPVTVTLTQHLKELSVTKKITFYKDGHYDVAISLSKDARYVIYLGHRPVVSKKLMAAAGALVVDKEGVIHIIEDGDADETKTFKSVQLISAFDQYTATMAYNIPKNSVVTIQGDSKENPIVYFDGAKDIKFNGYLGPKEYKTLKSIDPVLVNAIEFGWFTWAAKPLFGILLWLHSLIGNWGWAIIALTFLVRVVLYPLTYRGMVSMQKMKLVAPKIKEIQQKYKGDPQRLNAATMELYKKEGVNPFGGCLPILLQIPVFFAIYRVLLNAVELQGAPWILWIDDLSRMDPTFILPILMGVSMWYQQKLTPTNFTDPMQEKIMKFLPVIFTFFFVTFPSGLVLYWLVNNIFSIIQQQVVNKQFEKYKQLKAKKEGK